jgi:hypothetical protein
MRAILLLFFGIFLLSCSKNNLHTPKTYLNLKSNLKSGPYSVGFKLVHEYDFGRTYAIKYDHNGKRFAEANPRPMQIAIWYPASASEKLMKYKEYIHADATKDNFRTLSKDDLKQIEKDFIHQRLFRGLGVADTLYMKNLLEIPTTAVKDAPHKEGSFPLILFINREYRGISINTVLMEYLASHGYIVVTTPSKDRTKSFQTSMTGVELIQSNIEDIQFVKRYMQDFEYLNTNKIGILSYFVGSVASALLAQTDQSIDAVVNIQSILNTDFFGQTNLDKFTYFNGQEIQTPILDLWQAIDPKKIDEAKFYNSIKYADAHNYRVTDSFEALAFSSYFNVAWVKSTDIKTDKDKAFFDEIYSTINTYTLAFFNAYLKDDSSERLRVLEKPANSAFTIEKRSALEPAPTEAQFVKFIQENGANEAITLFERHKKANPDLKILTSSSILNNLGYNLLNQNKVDDAIELFLLNVRLFPNDANIQDSLGEGYKAKGDKTRAIIEYKKVFNKNPSQATKDNTIKMLKELGVDYK